MQHIKVALLAIAFTMASLLMGCSVQHPLPTSSPSPAPTTSWPTRQPSPSASQAEELATPRGEPTKLTVKRGDTVLAEMPFRPRVIDGNNFASECGAVAWWDVTHNGSQWPKPGEKSLRKALVTGHVMCGRDWYDLAYLQGDGRTPGGHKGDRLYTQYSSGDVVVGVAGAPSANIDKTKLNSDRSRTHNAAPARVTRLSTCNRELPLRPNGTARHNAAQDFTTVEVILKK